MLAVGVQVWEELRAIGGTSGRHFLGFFPLPEKKQGEKEAASLAGSKSLLCL